MSKGYVYILSNPAMPGLLKIGKTTRSVEARAGELFQTGVPEPFKVVDEVYSPDCHDLEYNMHQALGADRVSPNREFFRCDTQTAIQCLLNFHKKQVHLLCEEFLPDHRPYYYDEVPDPDVLAEKAREISAHPFALASAINYMSQDEARALMDRWNGIVEERRSERLKLVENG